MTKLKGRRGWGRQQFATLISRCERKANIRKVLQWFFRSRKTGVITIAQAPNLLLWIAIVTGILLWLRPSSFVLIVAFRGGLLIWAGDEIVRGVNPWRRCLGSAVAAYELTTLLR